MRHFSPRTAGVAVMFFVLILPFSLLGKSNHSTKPLSSSQKTTPEEILLTAPEVPSLDAAPQISKERRTPGLPATPDASNPQPAGTPGFRAANHPREDRLVRGHAFHGDVRTLPQTPPEKFELPEREEPRPRPTLAPGTATSNSSQAAPAPNPPSPSAPAPAPSTSFDGLDFANWGAGHPPDPNGDVGPTYYIQSINTSVGIYRKSDDVRVAAFAFNTLMSQGAFGNLCDTNNFGDPVVLYDTFEDRWIIADFAFQLDGSNNIVNPPGALECFAVSKSGDPVGGGWNFYSIQVVGGFGDYPKLGIWPDGLYMSANVFGYASGAAFQNPRVWALNKAQMYAGTPSVQVVTFDAPAADFAVLPSNARLQTGTPPPGTPNYFLSTEEFLNGLTVYKFHVNWASPLLSTFTGPDVPIASTSWPNSTPPNALSQGGNALDVLAIRAMVQNQYTNLGGTESLWVAHTVRRGNTSGFAAPRYYQVDVTGGTVAASLPQAATWDPDAANIISRFMPSVAVDRAGNMALGYSTSSSTTFPAIKYAGRLAADPINTLSQTEQVLFQGSGTQSGTCGSTCIRWGDYSAMTLDPDGCTFWYTNEYYAVTGLSFLTRIGTFSYPSCTPVGAGGTVQGTVTATAGGAPISGATVALGSRTTTTNTNGNYAFSSIPAGTYPSITASQAGSVAVTVASIAVSDGGTTTQDFSLSLAPTIGCLVDTSQADFQAGAITNCDLTGSPGDVTLLNADTIDQQNTTVSNSGVGITITTWGGQTFTPAVTGSFRKAAINLFCSGCTGTTPNLTLSLRATSGGLPTGADIASTTIAGFGNGGVASDFTANFSSPATLSSGTQYALVIRPTANPSPGTYALTRSSTDVYAGGTRVSGATSGTVWSRPLTAGSTTDAGFKIFMNTGFASSGTFVSSAKDSNPDSNSSAGWGTISWTADTPAGTTVQFQAAASNNVSGPFNFVGPDGTVATFFANGGSLAQFSGNRYLEYRASFTTSDATTSASLHDVTICFNNALVTTLTVSAETGTFGGTTNLSATLTAGGTGVSGETVSFALNGNSAGSATTDGSGSATVLNASLTGINPASYPSGIAATFAGDSSYQTSSGTASLTVSKADQAITFGALSGQSFGDPDFTIGATASSSLAVSFTASGNCSVTGSSVHLTGAGSCTITASQAGDSSYNPAPDVPQSFSIAKSSQTITFGGLATKAFGVPDFVVSGTASSSLPVSFAASGNCSVAGSTVHLTGTGSCTITASQAGDSNYSAAPDVPQSFSITKSDQTITFASLAAKTLGAADFAVVATASSNLAVSFTASGNCSIAGSTVHLTGAGSCAITAAQAGDANYNPAADVPQSFSIAKGSQTITFGALSAKTFGAPDFAVNATASSALAVSFIATGNCAVAGSTVHLTGAGSCTITASQTGDGNYNPAPSVPQSLTINKGLPLVTLSCPPAGFDINPHACTAAVTGVGNVTVTGATTVTYNSNPAPPASAGTYSVSASFTSSDGSYTDATGTGSLVIAKAAPTVTVTCPASVVFDSSPHACTDAASGVGSVTVAGSSVLTYDGGSAPTTGGTYVVSASFTSADSNYGDTTGIGSLTIAKASQTIAFGALATKTLGDPDFVVSATASSILTVSFTASGNCTVAGSAVHLTGGGSCTITASQTGNADYNPAANVPRSFTINPGGDFTIAPTLPSVTVTAGQAVIEHITITPNPSTLTALTFTCSRVPAKTSCTFTPNSVPPGSAPTDVVMTISTKMSTMAALEHPRALYASWLGFSSLGLIGVVVLGGRRKSRKKSVVLGALSLMVVLMTVGCGGGSSSQETIPGTPLGTSAVTVTGSTTAFTHSTTFTLTVR